MVKKNDEELKLVATQRVVAVVVVGAAVEKNLSIGYCSVVCGDGE